jgi:hypothetical protein
MPAATMTVAVDLRNVEPVLSFLKTVREVIDEEGDAAPVLAVGKIRDAIDVMDGQCK